jgi:DNA-binding protein HU-beta
MNKEEFVREVASRSQMKKNEISKVLDCMINTIMETVADGEKLMLVGFGSFEPRSRKARQGRNPQTGDVVEIPSATVPYFSAGKRFKEKVN